MLMVFCPQCGYENDENEAMCLHCGYPIIAKPNREKIAEHSKHALNMIKKNPEILLPKYIYNLLSSFSIFTLYDSSLTVIFNYIDNFSLSNLNSISTLNIPINIAATVIISTLYHPFNQHLYLTAVHEKQPSYYDSFLYMKTRYFEFFKASFILYFFSFFSAYLVSRGFEAEIIGKLGVSVKLLVLGAQGLIILVILLIMLWMSLARKIMVWGDIGFINSSKTAVVFVKSNFRVLFWVGVVYVVRWFLKSYPFLGLINFFLMVFINLVEIDIFLSYMF